VKALNEEIKSAFWKEGGRRPMQGGTRRGKSLSEVEGTPYLESCFFRVQWLRWETHWKLNGLIKNLKNI
jgi:hypothetical protein